MRDTETWAMRIVEGGELYLRRRPGARWEVTFYERCRIIGDPFFGGVYLHSDRLAGHYFLGQTFGSPDEAAEIVRRLVAA